MIKEVVFSYETFVVFQMEDKLSLDNKMLNIYLKTILICLLAAQSLAAVSNPIDAIGTVLPQLNPNSPTPARIFNDLMKQSLQLVPYTIFPWGGSGRCWSCTLSQINGQKHQYPASLPSLNWAVAEIPFFFGID